MMTVRRSGFAIALAVVLGLAVGCGKKAEDDTGGGGGGSGSGSGSAGPDIPNPPSSSGPLTANWTGSEITDAKREASRNLKQIGVAIFNYEMVSGHFPAGFYDKSGKKLGLSWRVAILPHIEQDALFKEFKLDEPWDSEHNKKLVRKMPKVFAPLDSSVPNGYTYYRGFGGEGALGHLPQGSSKGGMPARGTPIVAFTDGLSNTIFAAELAEPVIWTKPDDDYDAKKPVPKFGGVFADGFHVLMCDGSVRFVKRQQSEQTLRALITRNGGEVVTLSN